MYSGTNVSSKKTLKSKDHRTTLWCSIKGRRVGDRMVVGFTTIYAISAYYH